MRVNSALRILDVIQIRPFNNGWLATATVTCHTGLRGISETQEYGETGRTPEIALQKLKELVASYEDGWTWDVRA